MIYYYRPSAVRKGLASLWVGSEAYTVYGLQDHLGGGLEFSPSAPPLPESIMYQLDYIVYTGKDHSNAPIPVFYEAEGLNRLYLPMTEEVEGYPESSPFYLCGYCLREGGYDSSLALPLGSPYSLGEAYDSPPSCDTCLALQVEGINLTDEGIAYTYDLVVEATDEGLRRAYKAMLRFNGIAPPLSGEELEIDLSSESLDVSPSGYSDEYTLFYCDSENIDRVYTIKEEKGQ